MNLIIGEKMGNGIRGKGEIMVFLGEGEMMRHTKVIKNCVIGIYELYNSPVINPPKTPQSLNSCLPHFSPFSSRSFQ